MRINKIFLSVIAVFVFAGFVSAAPKVNNINNAAGLEDKIAGSHSTIYGGIEIGSKGVKGIAFEVMEAGENDEIVDIKQLYKQSINTTIISGMKDGNLAKSGIDETASAVAELYNDMKKFNPVVVVCAGSSAVGKAKNKEELTAAIKTSAGLDAEYINKDQEVFYGIISSIPKKRWTASILIDVGSGNTKIGYIEMLEKTPRLVAVEIPYGTISLKDKTKDESGLIENIYDNVLRREVVPQLKNQAQNKPALINRKRKFIIGGASWVVANFTHPEMIKRQYVKLSLNDISQFRKQLVDNGSIFTPELKKLDKETADKALKEFNKIKDVFTYEDILSGASLLKTVLASLTHSDDYIFFPRESGWIGGYAILKGMKN